MTAVSKRGLRAQDLQFPLPRNTPLWNAMSKADGYLQRKRMRTATTWMIDWKTNESLSRHISWRRWIQLKVGLDALVAIWAWSPCSVLVPTWSSPGHGCGSQYGPHNSGKLVMTRMGLGWIVFVPRGVFLFRNIPYSRRRYFPLVLTTTNIV